MSANHGVKSAEWALEKIELVEQTKWLQRKVKKQAAVLNKLEEKLRKSGQKPYAEE